MRRCQRCQSTRVAFDVEWDAYCCDACDYVVSAVWPTEEDQ